jgi:hypothetical protein
MEKPLTSAEKHRAGLLILRLRLDKTHLRALRRDDDRLGVRSIVFVVSRKVAHIAVRSAGPHGQA